MSLAIGQQILTKIDGGISGHNTYSIAAEPFHVLHMDPMGDVSMCYKLLVAHLCQSMPCFGLQPRKVWQCATKSEPNLSMAFLITRPYQ
jgi:hypothetical protein